MKYNYLFLIAILFLDQTIFAGTVYIVHYAPNYTDSMLFNPNHHAGAFIFLALKEAIRKQGHNCTMLPDSCYPIDSDAWFIALERQNDEKKFNLLSCQPKNRCIMLMWEPPATLLDNYFPNFHTPFKAIFTLFHEIVDNQKYFPLYYPQPFLYMIPNLVSFEQKKLCTMISGDHTSQHPNELYSARRSIINFFETRHPKDFDFYGRYWTHHNHPCYKGIVDSKTDYLKNYKFAICFENMTSKTYLTEKIFDILHAGCVPVYWGAKDIKSYIPYNAYILREDFGSDEELYDYLNSITEADYLTYLTAAKDFFESDYAYKFSIESFVTQMIKAIFD